jgi:hypothetical protein
MQAPPPPPGFSRYLARRRGCGVGQQAGSERHKNRRLRLVKSYVILLKMFSRVSSEDILHHMVAGGNMYNKRRHFRMDMREMEVNISDDIGFCSASVANISRSGICLFEMSRKLRVKNDNFLIIISVQGVRFKTHAQSRWEIEQRLDTILGVELKNIPWDWTDFVSNLEPAEDDVWSSSGRILS